MNVLIIEIHAVTLSLSPFNSGLNNINYEM